MIFNLLILMIGSVNNNKKARTSVDKKTTNKKIFNDIEIGIQRTEYLYLRLR